MKNSILECREKNTILWFKSPSVGFYLRRDETYLSSLRLKWTCFSLLFVEQKRDIISDSRETLNFLSPLKWKDTWLNNFRQEMFFQNFCTHFCARLVYGTMSAFHLFGTRVFIIVIRMFSSFLSVGSVLVHQWIC